jgi:hypothetical protein
MEGIELLLASRSMKTRLVRGQAYEVSETRDHERMMITLWHISHLYPRYQRLLLSGGD